MKNIHIKVKNLCQNVTISLHFWSISGKIESMKYWEVHMLTELMQTITANLVDFIIYAAIALVTVTGFVKCIFPTRSCARH